MIGIIQVGIIQTVYPCAYREHFKLIIRNEKHGGLSLCIQGTSQDMNTYLEIIRFIPVHTGNISILQTIYFAPPVYPCAYREHQNSVYPKFSKCGLSLCIQGTLKRLNQNQPAIRFIPVHTGNIKMSSVSFLRYTVYPCAYREH